MTGEGCKETQGLAAGMKGDVSHSSPFPSRCMSGKIVWVGHLFTVKNGPRSELLEAHMYVPLMHEGTEAHILTKTLKRERPHTWTHTSNYTARVVSELNMPPFLHAVTEWVPFSLTGWYNGLTHPELQTHPYGQPKEKERERERERETRSQWKGEQEAGRGREIVRSEVSIFGNLCLCFNPTILPVPRSVCFVSCHCCVNHVVFSHKVFVTRELFVKQRHAFY